MSDDDYNDQDDTWNKYMRGKGELETLLTKLTKSALKEREKLETYIRRHRSADILGDEEDEE